MKNKVEVIVSISIKETQNDESEPKQVTATIKRDEVSIDGTMFPRQFRLVSQIHENIREYISKVQ